METLLRRLLELKPPAADTLEAWWQATRNTREVEQATARRALIGGVLADRLGFAFAAGYQAALQALVGQLDGITSLCVTETAGNRPQDMTTTLRAIGPERYELTGKKRWATGGPLAKTLLVAAATGTDASGKNKLRVVRIPARLPGVRMIPTSAPFIPEVPHCEIELEQIEVTSADLLPGDGFDDYVKPFRTIEDTHVHAALLGYIISVARRVGVSRELIEQLLACTLSICAIAEGDPRSPTMHVALAGALQQIAHFVGEIELRWEDEEGPEWTRWQRDRTLLRVAGAARAARRDRAWTALQREGTPSEPFGVYGN